MASGDYLDVFQKEILRWNSSINLISRQNTAVVCRNLVSQCREAFELFWSWYVSVYGASLGRGIFYADLGSGGGLPGVVWSHLLFGQGVNPLTVLVEPREKRAWFLERVARLSSSCPFGVFQGRWGAGGYVGCPGPDISTGIISLKALHLKEIQVLEGLVDFFGERESFAARFHRLVIVRFYPAEQEADTPLVGALGLPPLGGSVDVGGRPMVFDGCHIIGPTLGLLPASLVVTHYHRDQ